MTTVDCRGRWIFSQANLERRVHRPRFPSIFAICAIAAIVPALAEGQSPAIGNVALPTPNPNVFAALYPSAARLRCITGRLLAAYRVLPDGRIADARVVAADPKGVFESGFLTALNHSRANVPAGWTEAASRRVLYASVTYELNPCKGDVRHYSAADAAVPVCAYPIPGACPQ